MAGYFGTEHQQRLQQVSDTAVPWSKATPGACIAGRFLSTDEAEALGWETIYGALQRDGIFGFRMLKPEAEATVRAKVEQRGYRLDFWDVFIGDAAGAAAVSNVIVAQGMPTGFSEMPPLAGAEDAATKKVQVCMASCGVVPFSGSMLLGDYCPSVLVAIVDDMGEIAATAYGYLGHNEFSPFRRTAWGGLVAVSPKHRGKRLGNLVNAMMISRCFEQLDAEAVYELVSATNLPSRHMVQACGLRLSGMTCGLGTAGADRFTT